MNFFIPIAFIGLISIPIIIIMYLLKQKYKEHDISNLFLWKKAVIMSQSQRPWQKLRKNLLMFLQLLSALFLVLALANPYMRGKEQVENYILVLDTSLSMQAKDVSPSRFEKAKDDMISLVSSTKTGAKISLVVAGNSPYIAVNFSDDKKTVIDKIKDIKVTNNSINESSVASLIKILQEQYNGSVFVFSDNNYEFEGLQKQNILIGSSANNTAITLISHTVDNNRIVALVKVKNYGTTTTSNSVAVYTEGAFHDTKEITLSAGEEKDVFFTSIPANVKTIEARLTEPDILEADNSAYTVVSEVEKQKVLLVTKQNVFLSNMLSLLNNVDLYNATIDNIEELSGYYLYIFDGILPQKMPTDGHILVFNPTGENEIIETNSEVEITGIYSSDSHLLKFISNIQFDVLKSQKITTPAWADIVLDSPETPLIIAGQKDKQKIVVMGFDLHNTDLPLKKEFPIFIYNLMQYFIPSDVIGSGNIRTGDVLEFNIYPDAEEVNVVTPNGELIKIAPPFPVSPFTETDFYGVYTVEQKMSDRTVFSSFPVNTVITDSDLKRAENANTTDNFTIQSISVNKNLTYIFILIVILLLLAEWWVYCRGN